MTTNCSCSCTGCQAPALPEDVAAFIDSIKDQPHAESHLIEVLHRLQDEVGCLKFEQLDAVAHRMGVPAAKVTGVATFYHLFTFKPRGEHRISVCLGTACFVKGAGKVLDKLKELLQIQEGETSDDGLFSIESARCVGACALAPVVIVNDKVYGNVTAASVPDILAECGFKKS